MAKSLLGMLMTLVAYQCVIVLLAMATVVETVMSCCMRFLRNENYGPLVFIPLLFVVLTQLYLLEVWEGSLFCKNHNIHGSFLCALVQAHKVFTVISRVKFWPLCRCIDANFVGGAIWFVESIGIWFFFKMLLFSFPMKVDEFFSAFMNYSIALWVEKVWDIDNILPYIPNFLIHVVYVYHLRFG